MNEPIGEAPIEAPQTEPETTDTEVVVTEAPEPEAPEPEVFIPTEYVPPDITTISGVPSLRALFMPPASLSSLRIVRAVGRSALHRAALHFGLESRIQDWRDTTETLHLFFRNTQEPQPPECDCKPEDMPAGFRWWEADNDQPVSVYIIPGKFTDDQRRLIVTALSIIQAVTKNLKFEVVEDVSDLSELNIAIDSGPIDGSGGTLGFARLFKVGADDEYINHSTDIDVYLRMDSAESAFRIDRYFLSVVLHELGHGCGLDHIDPDDETIDAVNEVMNARLVRFNTEATPNFVEELVKRYLARELLRS